jgi:DNA-directed RNA polymerase subunit RPC12/RpoP
MGEELHAVVCPHCGEAFDGELLPGVSVSAPSGFKCPHCRLFVPLERSVEPDEPAA